MTSKNTVFIIMTVIFVMVCFFILNSAYKSENFYIKETAPDETVNTYSLQSETEKININTADIPELMSLTGIGEVLAGRIIEYREKYGGFLDISELVSVKGIGESLFERIKDLITV